MFGKKKGQSTLEYALIIAVVVTALLGINIYVKRGVQGRLKESTDQIGRQFDPGNFTSAWQTVSSGETTSTEVRDISATSNGTITSTISSNETITKSEYEDWGEAGTQHGWQ